jgi:hypothetical protein
MRDRSGRATRIERQIQNAGSRRPSASRKTKERKRDRKLLGSTSRDREVLGRDVKVGVAEVLSRSETRVMTTKDTDEGAGEDGGAAEERGATRGGSTEPRHRDSENGGGGV